MHDVLAVVRGFRPLHVLRDCRVAKQLWDEAGATNLVPNFYNMELCTWLKSNSTCSKNPGIDTLPWKILFTVGIWNLRLMRNKAVFKELAPGHNILQATRHMAAEYYFCAGKVKTIQPRQEAAYQWEKPDINWF
ncbi:hypothetical protein ACB092_04G091700 [Castanea dentata]